MSTYNRKIPHLLKSERNWKKTRRAVLDREPFCRSCAALGYETPATTVDHIIPRARGGTDSDDNLQPLCNDCHDGKTAREKHGGLDDRPLVNLQGSKSGVTVGIEPREFGKSTRARFLNRGYHEKK